VAERLHGGAAGVATYLRVREREGRLLGDADVRRLPDLSSGHPLRDEWRQRADSAARLIRYLRRLSPPLAILDVGCGNGWLGRRLAELPGAEVLGVDRNSLELEQARRVFGDIPNLRFELADAMDTLAPGVPADVIVLASVIQYFEDLGALVERLTSWLAAEGEIHVLDSPLYEPVDVPAARERTRQHYEALGVPEMAAGYHHHAWPELAGLPVEVLYRPSTLARRIQRRLPGRPTSPFPWLRIGPGAPGVGR
jgi:SAM-dependent methyltransferase